MRVANRTIYDMIKSNLSGLSEEMSKAHEIVSSGKRISKLSDDPVGITRILNIKSTLTDLNQMERNITLGNFWLTESESVLTRVQEMISEANAISVQMSSSTQGASERASAAQNVQNILDEIISLANTEIDGRYIFSGSKTDTIPFDSIGSYSGDKNPFVIKIGRDTTMKVGNDGEAVFGTLFTTLSELRDDLQDNNVSGIQASIDSLSGHSEEISYHISDIGSKILRMEVKQNILEDLELMNTDRLSKIEDADIAEAIINLQAIELAYQAALTASSKVMELSLVNYLE